MSDPMQSVINPAAALFRPPAAPPPAAPAAPKIFSPEERIGTAEKLIEQSRKQESEAALALGKRQQEEAVFKTEQEAKLAKGEAELERKAKEGIEGSEAYQLQQDIEKEIAQARFAPTQRTAQENMMMMALINLVGFGIGAGGKGNSMAALGAMTGMLDGVQKGDMARYKQEREKFDSNLKALHERAVRVDTLIKRVADLQTRDKNAAMLELRAGLAQEGADWLRQYGDKFGLVKQQELSAQIRRDAEKMRDTAQKAKDAEDRARENRLAQVQREREAAQRRAELAFALRGMTQAKPVVVQGADGKMYQVDPSKLPMAPEGVAVTPFGKTTSGGAANTRYAFNINESFAQAATDLLNVSMMSGDTVLGTFAGMTGQSGDTMLKSLANTFARKVTPEDSRLMQQIVAGLDQNMARALGGGYATSTSKGLIQAYKEQVAQYGDSPLAQAMFLSRMKQELGVLAKAFKNHPGSNEGYVSDMKEYMDELEKAIPFNVKDVIAANRGAKQTVTDKFANLAQSPVRLRLPVTRQPGEQAGPGPGPESVTVGGKTYPRPAGMSDEDWNAYKREMGAK